ncbi:MAG: type III-B CRISPR module RAMP protein Cmr1 [Candidatus Thorarchaeota archaeon]
MIPPSFAIPAHSHIHTHRFPTQRLLYEKTYYCVIVSECPSGGAVEMNIRIETLTPIWTSGVDRKMHHIHESGIMGSLRWWYEAVVRGLGGEACNPTRHRCNFDEKKYRRSMSTDRRRRLREAGLCDACQVFGATGWRRRFQLEIVRDKTRPLWTPSDELINVRPHERKRGWYLPAGHMGEFTIRIEGDRDAVRLVAALLLFLERRGSLGARPQLGYGLFRIRNQEDVRRVAEGPEWEHLVASRSTENHLPALSHFVFFSYLFKPKRPGWWTRVPGLSRIVSRVQPIVDEYEIVPVAPALRNEWRYRLWKDVWGRSAQVFGEVRMKRTEEGKQLERFRSRVAVSWAHKVDDETWIVRGWAWQSPNQRANAGLWTLVNSTEVWQRVISREGILEVFPSGTTWPRVSQRDLMDILEASR